MEIHWKEAFPWAVIFVVVLGLYLYVRAKRLGKK
jgi:lipopolysaccharide export LptBFGC system permease protein LptF